ncbi:MAG: hypothetical protein ACI8R9_002884, partial [Paraglaciecola sp.]
RWFSIQNQRPDPVISLCLKKTLISISLVSMAYMVVNPNFT